MPRRAHKVDGNQLAIVRQLRAIPGVSVAITSSLGAGFPDLVIGRGRRNYLIEIKDGTLPVSRRQLTPEEQTFHQSWCGQVNVCKNIDEILIVIGIGDHHARQS